MRRAGRTATDVGAWLRRAAAVAPVLFAWAALGLWTLPELRALRRSWREGAAVWLPIAALAAFVVTAGRGAPLARSEALQLVAMAGLVAWLSRLAFRRRDRALRGLVVGACLVLALVLWEGRQARSLWTSVGTQAASHDLATRMTGVQRLTGSDGPVWDDARRTWRWPRAVRPGEAVPARLTFDARLLSGAPGAFWTVAGRGLDAEPAASDDGAPATIVEVSEAADPTAYLARSYLLPGEGGWDVAYAVPLRSTGPEEACGVLVVRTGQADVQPPLSFCAPHEGAVLSGTASLPGIAAAASVEVVLTRLTGDLRVGRTTLTASGPDGRSVELISERTGVRVAVGPRADGARPATIAPRAAWTRYEVPLSLRRPADDTARITAHLKVEDGLAVEVRDAVLSVGADGRAAAPVAGRAFERTRLATDHPNILGHASALVAVTLLVAGVAPVPTAVGVAAAVVTIGLTGSRAAILVVAAAAAWIAARRARRLRARGGPRARRAVLVLAALVAAAIVAVTAGWLFGDGAALVERFRRSSGPARADIWSAAASALAAHPLAGLVGDCRTFAAYWREAFAADHGGASAAHAHDFVLHWAASYGVAGLLAAVATLVALVRRAAERAGMPGLAVAAALVVLNVVDASLLNATVLVTFWVCVEALRSGTPRPPAA